MSLSALFKLSTYSTFVKSIFGGLSVAGSGLAGWGFKPPAIKNPVVGEKAIFTTTDAQWRFLYLLGSKVFEYLKSQEDSSGVIEAKDKTGIIPWLESKFIKITSKLGWEGFKELCTKQLKHETIFSHLVKEPASRLCIIGKKISPANVKNQMDLVIDIASQKGNLKHLTTDKRGTDESPYKDLSGLKNWNISNYDLWKKFKNGKGKDVKDNAKHSNFEAKFKEWFEDTNTKIKAGGTSIKEALAINNKSQAK